MSAPSTLSLVGRATLGLGACIGAFLNPGRADLIGVIGETTSGSVLSHLRRRMQSTGEGCEMLSTLQPARFPSVNLREFRGLPHGTLGREYARFMDIRGFKPDERSPVRFIENKEYKWILQRYRDVHDIWHVLTGMPTTLLGEIGQKWFEWIQTGLPVAGLSSIVGPLRLKNNEQGRVLVRDLIPWALKSASQSVDLLAIRYEDYLEDDLRHLRKKWKIIMPDEFLREPHVLYRKKRV